MNAHQLKSDQRLYEEARGLNDRAALDLNTCSSKTLVQILEAISMYRIQERHWQAFGDEYSDIMSSIARKVGK